MNPGVSRLAIVIALVIGGVALLANGFSDSKTVAAPGDSPTPSSPSQTPSPARSPQQSIVPNQEGVLVQVLNGTSTPGLAADFEAMLVDQGGYLEAGTPGDAPDKPVVDSVVYFRQDGNKAQNKADAQLLSETYLGGVPVKPLPAALKGVVSRSADVVVVLGEDQAGTP
jgi:LytR cell envelope-related transcriptional attenuator